MLNVATEIYGEMLIVRCWGRLVAGQQAWTLYNAVISEEKHRIVVVDLSGVNRVDARGLGVLVVLKQWASGSGIALELIPSQQVEELLELTHLRSLFDVRSSISMESGADLASRSHSERATQGRCA